MAASTPRAPFFFFLGPTLASSPTPCVRCACITRPCYSASPSVTREERDAAPRPAPRALSLGLALHGACGAARSGLGSAGSRPRLPAPRGGAAQGRGAARKNFEGAKMGPINGAPGGGACGKHKAEWERVGVEGCARGPTAVEPAPSSRWWLRPAQRRVRARGGLGGGRGWCGVCGGGGTGGVGERWNEERRAARAGGRRGRVGPLRHGGGRGARVGERMGGCLSGWWWGSGSSLVSLFGGAAPPRGALFFGVSAGPPAPYGDRRPR